MGNLLSMMKCFDDNRPDSELTPDEIYQRKEIEAFRQALLAANEKLKENGVDVEKLAKEAGV